MADRGREHHLAVRDLGAHRTEMEDDAVGLGGSLRDLLGFLRRHIEHLHSPGRDLFLVVMEVLVPLLQGHVGAREF